MGFQGTWADLLPTPNTHPSAADLRSAPRRRRGLPPRSGRQGSAAAARSPQRGMRGAACYTMNPLRSLPPHGGGSRRVGARKVPSENTNGRTDPIFREHKPSRDSTEARRWLCCILALRKSRGRGGWLHHARFALCAFAPATTPHFPSNLPESRFQSGNDAEPNDLLLFARVARQPCRSSGGGSAWLREGWLHGGRESLYTTGGR